MAADATLSEAAGEAFTTSRSRAGTPINAAGSLSEAAGDTFTDRTGAGEAVAAAGSLSEAGGVKFTDHIATGTDIEAVGSLSEAAGQKTAVALTAGLDADGTVRIDYTLGEVAAHLADRIEYRVDGGDWQSAPAGRGGLTPLGITPMTTPEQDMTDDVVPDGWTDDRQGVNAEHPFEYCSSRPGTTMNWQKFRVPALVGNYALAGLDGEDGESGREEEIARMLAGAEITGAANLPDPDWHFDQVGSGESVIQENLSETDRNIATLAPMVFAVGDILQLGNEFLLVNRIDVTNVVVMRAALGSAAATHPNGSVIRRAGIIRGNQTYYDGNPPDISESRPYRIRFRRPVPGSPAPDADIGTVAWVQEPAVRVHGVAGLDGTDGGEYEYVFCATALGGTITGSANLPDPDWHFDEPNLATTGGILRGNNNYFDGTPGDVSAAKPFVHRFKRRVQGFPAANSDIGRVAWQQEPAFRYWAVDGEDGTSIEEITPTSTGITIELSDDTKVDIPIKQVVDTSRNADTGVVTVTYSDGSTDTYTVPDGDPGAPANLGSLQIQRIYRRTTSPIRPSTPASTAAQRQQDEYTPTGASRSYTAPNATSPYAWVAYRYGISGAWTHWTDWQANGFHASILASATRSAESYPPVDIAPAKAWSDQVANDTTRGNNVLTDTVTQYNEAAKWTETRYWDGTDWVVVDVKLSGNYFFDGGIGARKLDVENLSALNIKVVNADVEGVISAEHISADVINVETLWEGVAKVSITSPALGNAIITDSETINLDKDIDPDVHGSLLILANPVIGVQSNFSSEEVHKDRLASTTLKKTDNSTLVLTASARGAGGQNANIGSTSSFEVIRVLGVKGNPGAATKPSLTLNDAGQTIEIEEGAAHTFVFALSEAISTDCVVTCALSGAGAGSDVSFQSGSSDVSESVTIAAGSTDGMITVYGRDEDGTDTATLTVSTTNSEVDSDANSSEATIDVTAPPVGAPGAPRSVSAAVGDYSSGSDENDIRASYRAPSDWGTGATNTRMFELRLFRGGTQVGATVTRAANTTSYDFEVLDNGTYSVEVRAITGDGESDWQVVGSLVVNVTESTTFSLSPSSDQDIEEGESQLFTITLAKALTQAVTFDIDLSGRGAGSDVSFSSSSSVTSITRSIAAGSRSTTFRVYARDDDASDDATLTVGTDSSLVTTSDIEVDIEPTASAPTLSIVYGVSVSVGSGEHPTNNNDYYGYKNGNNGWPQNSTPNSYGSLTRRSGSTSTLGYSVGGIVWRSNTLVLSLAGTPPNSNSVFETLTIQGGSTLQRSSASSSRNGNTYRQWVWRNVSGLSNRASGSEIFTFRR